MSEEHIHEGQGRSSVVNTLLLLAADPCPSSQRLRRMSGNIGTQVIHVGTPSARNLVLHRQVKTVLLAFHNSDDISMGNWHAAEKFAAFGVEWSVSLLLYRTTPTIDAFCFIECHRSSNDDPIKMHIETGVWTPGGMKNKSCKLITFGGTLPTLPSSSYLVDNLQSVPRSHMVDGALILRLNMYTDQPQANAPSVSYAEFIPMNPFLDNVLKEYGNEETSDVTIEVGGEEETRTGRRKRARTDSTAFHAHQFVLRCNAPTLAEMCKPGDEPVRIGNVSPETFKHLLYYCYGGKISDEDLKERAKEIIDAADRFGVANLKLEAESHLVQEETFTVENILDNLLYADSKNCALLLEKAMDFVVENKKDIIGKVSLTDLPGTMCMDMLTAMTQAQEGGKSDAGDDIDLMRVSELRKRLHTKGLCVDGSRKAMIELLKESSESY